MQLYFYQEGLNQKGPVSFEELRILPLTKDTLVWKEGMQEWKKAGAMEEFNDYFKTIPPPISTLNDTTSRLEPKPPIVAFSNSTQISSGSGKLKMGLGIAIIAVALIGAWGYIETTKEELVEKAVEQQQVQADDQKAEEERRALEVLELRKKTIRNSIMDYVGYSETYNVEAFGGINNVLVKVNNNTDYPIDEVVVRVTYIKDNGGIWTTYDVKVRNIAAKGSSVERADDSNRGTRINGEIISIKSKELDLCFEGLRAGADPYRCR